jgi:hypothetical protein
MYQVHYTREGSDRFNQIDNFCCFCLREPVRVSVGRTKDELDLEKKRLDE